MNQALNGRMERLVNYIRRVAEIGGLNYLHVGQLQLPEISATVSVGITVGEDYVSVWIDSEPTPEVVEELKSCLHRDGCYWAHAYGAWWLHRHDNHDVVAGIYLPAQEAKAV